MFRYRCLLRNVVLKTLVVFLYCQPSKPNQPKTRFFFVSQISQVSQNVSQMKLAYLAKFCHVTQLFFDITFCLFFSQTYFLKFEYDFLIAVYMFIQINSSTDLIIVCLGVLFKMLRIIFGLTLT